MTYSVQLSEEAKFDVLESFRWYELQRDGLGFDFELCVEAGLNFISRHPEAIQIRYDDIAFTL